MVRFALAVSGGNERGRGFASSSLRCQVQA